MDIDTSRLVVLPEWGGKYVITLAQLQSRRVR